MKDNSSQPRPAFKRRTMATTAIAFIAMTLVCSRALGDGGTLRLNETAGPYRVSVFTSPSPPRAGRVDVSVLVQDASTSAILPDATVNVSVSSFERPEVVRGYVATHEAATNKLLVAAECELPVAGEWRIDVDVESQRADEKPLADGRAAQSNATFTLEVGEPLPGWWDMTPWIGWPVVAIGLFGAHQVLAIRSGQRHHRLRHSDGEWERTA